VGAQVLGHPEWGTDPKFAKTAARQQGPARPGDKSGPQVVSLPIAFGRQRPRSPSSAPKLGEHTEEVLGKRR